MMSSTALTDLIDASRATALSFDEKVDILLSGMETLIATDCPDQWETWLIDVARPSINVVRGNISGTAIREEKFLSAMRFFYSSIYAVAHRLPGHTVLKPPSHGRIRVALITGTCPAWV